MVSRWHRIVLAAALFVLGLLASLWWREASVLAVAGLAIAGLSVCCLVATLLTYAIMLVGRLRHGEPRPGAFVLLRGVVGEWLAFVALFAVIQPFERWWMGDDADTGQDADDRPTMLLVHGYCCNRGLWWSHRRDLLAQGTRVVTVNLEPAFAGIDDFAEILHWRIAALGPGAGPIIIVGHSMGGLVARAYLERHGAGSISKVITIGTPHHGTGLARLGLGRCAREMERGNAFLRRLATGRPLSVPFLSVWSSEDNFLVPASSSQLTGARHLHLAGIGHLSMAFSRRIGDILREEARCAHDVAGVVPAAATGGSPA